MEGTFLRMTGVRGRALPLSAVDTVWPAESVLLISSEEHVQRSRVAVPQEEHSARPGWEDETLPWWELVPDLPSGSFLDRRDGIRPLPAIASVPSLIKGAIEAFASYLGRLMKQAPGLARALASKAARISLAALRAVDSARVRASRRLGAGMRRFRRRLAVALLQGAVWIAGSREELLEPNLARDSVEDEDTAEIS